MIEELAQIPVRVELASEFRYREMPLVKDGLVIVISQSGETADTLAAMRMAKDKGLATLAVVNVIGSSIAREADKVFYTLAGPEISVATTKGYSAQLVALDCIAVQFAKVKGHDHRRAVSAITFPSFRQFRRRLRRFFRIRRESSGSQPNMRMHMMSSL